MVAINPAQRTVALKVVYYGPGLSGKTTNLELLHRRFPEARRGDLVRLDTEQERTLFFDYFPVNLGRIGGYRIKVDMFTVPGQSFYNATRRVVLEGADGVIFVADSQLRREAANIAALRNLQDNLRACGLELASVPHVFQWNKRDMDRVLSVPMMERSLNPTGQPSFEAVATTGTGVWETQSSLLELVLKNLRGAMKTRRQREAR